jgi:hypothetical protein
MSTVMENLETDYLSIENITLIVELASKSDAIDCFLGVDREGNHS